MLHLAARRAFAFKPGANDEAAAGLQHPARLGEEAALVDHVLRALDRIGAVEGGIREAVVEPVADVAGEAWTRPPDRRLGFGEGEAGHRHAAMLREPAGGRAVAAAYVDEALAGLEREPLGDQPDQRLGRLGRALPAGAPIAVMDMLAPDAAIGDIKLVIMARDVGGRLRAVGIDHGTLVARG